MVGSSINLCVVAKLTRWFKDEYFCIVSHALRSLSRQIKVPENEYFLREVGAGNYALNNITELSVHSSVG